MPSPEDAFTAQTMDRFGNQIGGLNTETSQTGTRQRATNVLDVLNPLSSTLDNYGTMATNLYNAGLNYQPQQLGVGGTPGLNNNFAGANQLKALMGNGVDYIGQQGIAQGQQNLALQEGARQRQLASGLGQNAGNQSLLNVLRSQGGLQMGLAGQGLTTQAQQGTLERGLQNINLQNQNIANRNTNIMNTAGFNNNAALGGLAARSAAMQPSQNLLDTLTNLQGQGRGVNTTETGIGNKNYQ